MFLLHGTPGSRRGPRPRAHELGLMGIRLIAYDRPGYGESDRHVHRQVVDAAADVAAVADALGLDRFAVVGRSGGGPHALACAAQLGDRVTGAAALVSLAPRHAVGLDWFAGMAEANVQEYTAAWRAHDEPGDPVSVACYAGRLARSTDALINREFLRTELGAGLPLADREILADPGIRELVAENFRGAASNGRNLAAAGDGTEQDLPVLVGWHDDTCAFSRDWGFDPADIEVPVLLWHGEADVVVPADHSCWLAGRIPGSTLVLEHGSGHFGALIVLPSVLQWLQTHGLGDAAPRAQV